MPLRRKRYRMDIGATVTPATNDDRAGDEAFMQSIYDSTNGGSWADNTGWNDGNMSLSDSPHGITTDTIGGELRITKVDLRNNNLTGNINFTEWENLKENTYVNVTFNSLNSAIPQELIDLPKCEYYYFSRSDTGLDINTDPHEQHATGSGDVGPGKGKGSEENVFTGDLPAPSDPSNRVVKWFVLSWTDSDTDVLDGISSLPKEIFMPSMVGFQFHSNQNVSDVAFPNAEFKAMTSLGYINIRQGSDYGFFTGSISADTFENWSSCKFLRLQGHESLTVDISAIDFTGMTALQAYNFGSCDVTGDSFPAEIVDGTLPNIFEIMMTFTVDDIGCSGTIPAVDPNLNGGTGLKIFKWTEHSFTAVDASLWDQTNIIQLALNNNKLTTIGTNDLSGMNSLRYLRLYSNELHEDAPYLPWDREIPGGIQIQDNKYLFKHLLYVPPNAPAGETLLELYYSITQAGELDYSPQKNFGSQDDYDPGTSTIDFSGIVSHADNSYEWFRSTDSGSTFNTISGETGNTLDVSTYDTDDQFYLEVTNSTEASIGEGMTLTSETITI